MTDLETETRIKEAKQYLAYRILFTNIITPKCQVKILSMFGYIQHSPKTSEEILNIDLWKKMVKPSTRNTPSIPYLHVDYSENHLKVKTKHDYEGTQI